MPTYYQTYDPSYQDKYKGIAEDLHTALQWTRRAGYAYEGYKFPLQTALFQMIPTINNPGVYTGVNPYQTAALDFAGMFNQLISGNPLSGFLTRQLDALGPLGQAMALGPIGLVGLATLDLIGQLFFPGLGLGFGAPAYHDYRKRTGDIIFTTVDDYGVQLARESYGITDGELE